MKKKRNHLLISMLLIFILIVTAVCVFYINLQINYDTKKYTEAEHLQRVAKLIGKKYMDGSFNFTGYELHPIYTANDEFRYILVDFEPVGYVYVQVHPGEPISVWLMGMYGLSAETYNDEPWRRYTIELGTDSTMPDKDGNIYTYEDVKWEQDSNGNYIDYYDSHFKVAGIGEEKKYLLNIRQGGYDGLIPAVKRGDKYINLMSMKEIEYKPIYEELLYAMTNDIYFQKDWNLN